MSLEDWNGLDRFLAGNQEDNTGEWLHMVMQNKPGYVQSHEKALEQVESYRDAYMMAYGIESEDLINPETKYSAEDLTE